MNAVRLPLRPGIGIRVFALVDVKSIVRAVCGCIHRTQTTNRYQLVQPWEKNVRRLRQRQIAQTEPKLECDASFRLSSFTSSATGKRRRRLVMETRPPFNNSSVSTFIQRPPGRSTVVFDQLPDSFKFHLGTIVATHRLAKSPQHDLPSSPQSSAEQSLHRHQTIPAVAAST